MQSSSSSSHFASFAAYTPPPDDPASLPPASKAPARPWFPAHASSQNDTSYQSGGIPTFGASAAGGLGAVEEAEGQQNQWETRHGLRVDMLAAVAYLLGPISALALLIIETHNDYVRFHAYQSALLTTPLVVVRILASLLGFWGWLRTILTVVLIGVQLYMAVRAYLDAAQNGLARYQLPYIGPIAERWLEEE
ncbi:hypothetical protein MVEN_01539700 [Mycena venus]|uniref:Uncharacterized protein n=1 Tax=Mycena venus TaxID=2733690 RepID=A0A8H6XVA6_9AGAR|nr:hypothetical protein MVEN_01539700 [Mycena venus]